MPAPGFHLYFLALVPPQPVFEEVQRLKEFFHDHYSSKAALRSPPHLTLHMPFEWKTAKEEKLITTLNAFLAPVDSIELALKHFGCFEPRVIYIQVELNEDLIKLQHALAMFCRKELNIFNSQYRNTPYHPHITVAFRDLKKVEFAKAWETFRDKSFQASCKIDHITLLKHDGKAWEEHATFAL